MTGPWAGEHVVLFVDPATMERYWWPSSVTTIGSAVCVRNLVSQVKLMRQFKGEHVYPVVALSHTFMNTAYGGRERPHLDVKRYVTFGPGGAVALPTPEAVSIAGSQARVEMRIVRPLSTKEVTGDEIKF
jgi:hypothetical protein